MKDSRIEIINDIPHEHVGSVAADFAKTGAQVTVKKDNDGTFSVQAEFTPTSKYVASGSYSL